MAVQRMAHNHNLPTKAHHQLYCGIDQSQGVFFDFLFPRNVDTVLVSFIIADKGRARGKI